MKKITKKLGPFKKHDNPRALVTQAIANREGV